jgi:PAS domain S-box-containing protein
MSDTTKVSTTGFVNLESRLLERVDAAVMAVDLAGNILFANRFAEELYGWQREDVIGRAAKDLSGVAISDAVANEIMHALATDGAWEGTFDVRRPDGALLSVHAVDSPLYDNTGQLVGIVSVGVDASRERSLEAELLERRRSEEMQQFLADSAMVLASSLDYEQSIVDLARLAVPFLADVCMIDILEGDRIRRVAAVHGDPDKQKLVEELERRFPPSADTPNPANAALRSGESSYIESLSDDFIRSVARDDDHYRIVKALGFRSFVCVPLTARGRTIGAVTLVSCSESRHFGPEDMDRAREVARHAAIALDNARLYHDQQRARAMAEETAERLRQLQTLATALSRAVTVDEVTRVIRAIAMPPLEPLNRGLWLVNEEMNELEFVPSYDLGGREDRFGAIPIDAPLPGAQAARERAPVLMGSVAERNERFPALADVAAAGNAHAVLPLIAEERVLAVLSLGFKEEREFDEDETRYLVALADQCAQALARALLYDRERRDRDRVEADRRRIQELNHALQASLLPPSLPDIPGLDLVARYRPAMAGLEVGGDFYDVFDTGGDWAIVVGDVCGKGPEAAAVTAIARWTIRSVAMDIRPPAQVLRKVNEALVHQQLDDRFCTIAYGRIVPTAHGVRLSVCRGGHPAPLVLRANGDVESLGATGSLIGIFPDVRLWEETTQLTPGDAVVFYTDGVTEARVDGDQFGEDRLRAALAQCAHLDARSIADAIEAAVLQFAGDEPSDDVALLVARVPT